MKAIACCSPISETALSAEEADQLASTLKALAEPARIRLLSLIENQPDGEACVCHLTGPLSLGQPTVSHHLKVLEEAGFLTHERRGRWVYYRVVGESLAAIRDVLAPRKKQASKGAAGSRIVAPVADGRR